jgi:hypothetical protein
MIRPCHPRPKSRHQSLGTEVSQGSLAGRGVSAIRGRRVYDLVRQAAGCDHGSAMSPSEIANPDPESEWWTTSDIAAYLGVQVSTVTNYRKRGQMPAPDLTVGRTHMWRPVRIVAWHDARPRPGVGGRPPRATTDIEDEMRVDEG